MTVLSAGCTGTSNAAAPPPATPSPATTPGPVAAARAPGPDRIAGVLDRTVPPSGTGQFDVVPGGSPAPARGRVTAVRVEVEKGLTIDGQAFAAFALATLNDPRSWGRDGNVGFSRTAGDAPIHIKLATPATTDRLCGSLGTEGRLSCRQGPDAILNLARWVTGIPDYRGDLTGYRHYLVNHEIGHVLGHHHVLCPGQGVPAPVMQQQTLGLDGCRPNPWPYP
ncbi:DUF3152 domain-containing protein [Pseudonocardia endophytica]|uniref:DUF3152 domain-containing protein n=1 Tax=Pseudonocardia endophytica TaxID=401976 RepID=UPI001405279B|nr:DUF3152 domain-containing protein [Pseudonocardia endophytica]